MTDTFDIQSSPIGEITLAGAQPDPGVLSAAEIRNCFPGRVTIGAGGEGFVLEEAPLIGVAVELAEIWLAAERNGGAEALSFYGDYKWHCAGA